MDAQRLSRIGRALASETRAGLVLALLDGTAHTGQELARHVGVAASTASEHLGVLIDAGLVTVAAEGRHSYFRLADGDVAALLESTVALERDAGPPARPQVQPGLALARSCYDHLAGRLGVQIYERLLDRAILVPGPNGPELSSAGVRWFEQLGIDPTSRPRRSSRPAVRACLDWTERRHHLAGVVGARLLTTMLDERWLVRSRQRPRELRVTEAGRAGLAAHFGLDDVIS